MQHQVENEFSFSHAHYALKGITREQIFKNLSWKISDDLGASAPIVTESLDHIYKHREIILGPGLAIFDWQNDDIFSPYVAIFHLDHHVLLRSRETYPTKYVVVLVSPASQSLTHLRHLARISRLFHSHDILESLSRAQSEDGLLAVLNADYLAKKDSFAA